MEGLREIVPPKKTNKESIKWEMIPALKNYFNPKIFYGGMIQEA